MTRSAVESPIGTRHGSTLVELMVVLALMAFLLGVVTPALTAVPAQTSTGTDDQARLAAVRTGTAVTSDSAVYLPDGRSVPRGRDR